RAEEYLEGIRQIPGLREGVALLGSFESPALMAAAIEFVLEGLHLHQKLNKYLSFTDDVQQALDWLLHQGLDWRQGMRVMGLDDFLEQLREEMRSRYRQVNLRSAFDEVRDKLEQLLDRERDALDRLGDAERAARKRDTLDRLPHRLSEALDRLRDYAFE